MHPDKIRKTLEEAANMREEAARLTEKANGQLQKTLRVVNDSKVISMSEAARKARISRPTAYEMLKD